MSVAFAAIGTRGEALLVFLAVAVVALIGLWLLLTNASRRGAITDRGLYGPQARRSIDERIDLWLARSERGAALTAQLHAAGSQLTAGRFLLMCVASALATFVIVSFLFPAILALVAAIAAVWACFAWLRRRLDKRKELFVGQLPDIARLLSNAASAGLSIPAGLELCVREIDEPARGELQLVIDELSLGRSLDSALESLTRRLPSREISVLLTTLIIQQRAGGDTVQALSELSFTLDERRNTLREVSTLLAGAVYTSYLVPLLGLGALLLLDTLNHNTLHAMTTKPVGIVALVLAAGMYTAGSVLIRRASRIEL